ncbi:MAG: hypothetical protein PHW53_03560 [Patescibacteria group bacterium]|nr:hypothetical protein [Patescibacteria group bacterium]
MHPSNRKAIYIPVRGTITGVDIEEFLPIVDHPNFQRLRQISQLAQISMIYPAGTHTRFVHSLGTKYETERRIIGWNSQFDAYTSQKLLPCFGLLHDIGHFALSHASERAMDISHEQNAFELLVEMKEVIEKCGIGYEDLIALFKKENHLEAIVTNHPFGADKFDYLSRDACFTNIDVPNLASLDGHIYWRGNRLVIENQLDIIRRSQRYRRLYISAYGECYLRKSAMSAQRLIEKMWEYILREKGLRNIRRATDYQALTWFMESRYPACRRIADCYLSRRLPKTSVVFRLPGCGNDEAIRDKPIRVLEVSDETFRGWGQKYTSSANLTTLERAFEDMFGMEPESVIVTPQFHGERFVRQPIWLYINGEYFEVDELYPEEADTILALGRHYTAWRIGVLNPSDRKKLADHADEIREYLISE